MEHHFGALRRQSGVTILVTAAAGVTTLVTGSLGHHHLGDGPFKGIATLPVDNQLMCSSIRTAGLESPAAVRLGQ
jgi:hypothetical protein